jgi:microcystin-dependent protein
MSSTYSTNLAIELIGSGEQAGNWGSTTNTNLGTLIEQAISGYTTYSCTGGTDTLTMTNGADATARNMYIQLSNTGGGTLVVPANRKLYFIYNATASGAVTVKVSGQTGVSVPNGAKILLVCNGTDIVVAENYMISPTLSSPTLTGTPIAPTASVGTSTTQIATTQFVQQAGLTGEVKMWATGTAPSGYLFCNGQSVSTTTYAALFAVIAYTYGGSGGSFNVPDFSGRMPIGVNGTYTLASTGGAATTTISSANLPSHTHSFSATSGGMNSNTSHNHNLLGSSYHYVADGGQNNGGASANPFTPGSTTYGDVTATTSIDHTHSVSGTTGSAGSGTAATTISPYLGIYYIIKT